MAMGGKNTTSDMESFSHAQHRQLARQEQTMVSKRGEHARVHTYIGRGSVRRGSDRPPTIRLMVVNEVMYVCENKKVLLLERGFRSTCKSKKLM